MLQSESATATSRRMSSIISFERPYGFVVLSGKDSSIGVRSGIPYTVTDELKTMRFTSNACMTSRSKVVPTTLFT